MISSETPYKLAEIIRDTWPQLYRPPLNREASINLKWNTGDSSKTSKH